MKDGVETTSWALSVLGVPPKVNFLGGPSDGPGDYAKRAIRNGVRGVGPFNYYADPSSCQGTFIYIVDLAVEWGNRVSSSRSIIQPSLSVPAWLTLGLQEFGGVAHEDLPNQQFGAWDEWLEVGYYHGTEVASISSGNNIGVCKKATTFGIVRKSQVIGTKNLVPDDMITFAWKVADLLSVAENIAKNGRG